MRGRTIRLFSFVCLILAIKANPVFAAEIFHWVDEDGILNFSDWAPEDNNVEVSKLVVSESNPPGYDPSEDENSVLGQAERMSDRWEELKDRKEERKKQQLELAQQERLPQYVDYEYPYYYRPGYFSHSVRPPGFGYRPPFKTRKRQLVALDQLGLLGGPRPHSINSSAHLARINAGQTFNGSSKKNRVEPHFSKLGSNRIFLDFD
jgi:hypothetical protein